MAGKAKNSGLVLVAILSLLPALLWAFAMPLNARFGSFSQIMLSLGQVTALIGTALFALTLFLSARVKIFEKFFHGMNMVYERHSQLGQLALILLLFHPLLLLPNYAGSFGDAVAFLLPNASLAKDWGIFSLGLMILLIILTLYLRPKYNIWKWTHKFLGVAFFFGGLHVWMISSDTSRFLPLRIYILGLAALGLGAFFYRTIFGKFLVPKFRYEVTRVSVLNDELTEIAMKPIAKPMSFKAGQFVFIQFPKSVGISGESHPFSIVSGTEEPELKLAIKSLGDYTSKIANVKVGDTALIEGPYGAFSSADTEHKEQIWIAGGIGITPFISMAKSIKPEDGYQVDLFYCCRDEVEAAYMEILNGIAANLANSFRVHLFCSSEKGRISVDAIQDQIDHVNNKEVLLCAPPVMIGALRSQLVSKGVPLRLIHSEEFHF